MASVHPQVWPNQVVTSHINPAAVHGIVPTDSHSGRSSRSRVTMCSVDSRISDTVCEPFPAPTPSPAEQDRRKSHSVILDPPFERPLIGLAASNRSRHVYDVGDLSTQPLAIVCSNGTSPPLG
jgi:hypothetical protein